MLTRTILAIVTICFLYGCSDSRREREKVRDHILMQFKKQMKGKELYAVGIGSGCSKDGKNKINLLDITFVYPYVLDIKTSRNLIVESTETLLDLINSDPTHAQFFENFPAQANILMVSIIGEASDCGCDYIRTVGVIKGEVSYDTDDPTGKVMPYLNVHEETYEEAKKMLSNEIDNNFY
jgi:hypothetical protein